jgi:hypothetical protein
VRQLRSPPATLEGGLLLRQVAGCPRRWCAGCVGGCCRGWAAGGRLSWSPALPCAQGGGVHGNALLSKFDWGEIEVGPPALALQPPAERWRWLDSSAAQPALLAPRARLCRAARRPPLQALEHSHHPVDWEAPQHALAKKEPRRGRRLTLAAEVLAPGGRAVRVYCRCAAPGRACARCPAGRCLVGPGRAACGGGRRRGCLRRPPAG